MFDRVSDKYLSVVTLRQGVTKPQKYAVTFSAVDTASYIYDLFHERS